MPPGGLVNVAGGLALAALGVWLVRVRPRGRATVGVGAFALGFGLATALQNLALGWWAAGAALPFVALAVAGLVLVGLSFPEPLARRERRATAASLALGAVVVAPGVFALATTGLPPGPLRFLAPPSEWGPIALSYAATLVLLGAWWGVLFLLAVRSPRPDTTPARERSYALMTVALVLYPPAQMWIFLATPDPAFHVFAATSLGAFLALALAWSLNARRAAAPRTARNTALFVAGWPLAVAAYGSVFGWPGIFGAMRILAVVFLAYAILRHHLLGIDVRVRWGISRTTVAGIFITVFFIASEAAQEFFGDTLGSAYVGILAAGALVFAIAPLSRFADRIAERAIPSASPHSGQRDEQEEAFRASVRLALRGGISRDEEHELARIAEAHGLSPVRALELREEVEAAVGQHGRRGGVG